MVGNCWIATLKVNLLLALSLLMIEMTESAIVAVLASALRVEAAPAAQPCKVPERPHRRQIFKTFIGKP
jgi:hypothetical protein